MLSHCELDFADSPNYKGASVKCITNIYSRLVKNFNAIISCFHDIIHYLLDKYISMYVWMVHCPLAPYTNVKIFLFKTDRHWYCWSYNLFYRFRLKVFSYDVMFYTLLRSQVEGLNISHVISVSKLSFVAFEEIIILYCVMSLVAW